MVRVLHTGCQLCKSGGIENYIMNHYRKINENEFEFVFLIESLDDTVETFETEVNQLGGRVYHINHSASFLSKIKQKYNALKNIDFDIAHIHVSCGVRAIDGIICKLAKPKAKIIFHSHSNLGVRPLKYSLLIPIYRIMSNKLLACSKSAGQYFFGSSVIKSKKFKVANNSVDTNKFSFSQEKRVNVREQLDIDNETFLLGFVGRLSPEKNVPLFIDIVDALKKLYPKTKGVIVGDGSEFESVKTYINTKEAENDVVMVGNQAETDKFLSAMDMLVLPSENEGLGIVLIEAQSCALPCFATDKAPEETKISDLITYFDINEPAEVVAGKIIEFMKNNKLLRTMKTDYVKDSGFDLSVTASEMESIYSKLLKR